MMNSQLTLGNILERAGSLFGDVEIVSRLPGGALHRYLYADFYRRSRALARALQQAGLRRGERAGTLMYNHYAHLEAFFGVPAAGGVLHTVNHRLHPNDLVYILNHAEDKFLIIDDVLLPIFEQVRQRVTCANIIVVPHTGQAVSGEYRSYEDFLAGSDGEFTYPSLHENEGAIMAYTSGVAGSPKGVVYSHRALVLHSLAISLPDAAAVTQRDTMLPVVPMHHAHAWGVPLAATMAGCKQVFPGDALGAQSILDLFAEEQVTFSAGVPTVWLGLLHHLQREPQRWRLAPGLRAIVSGAAPPPIVIRELDRLGIRLIQAWGLTESGPLATFSTVKPSLENLPPEQLAEIRATQGRPLPFVELRSAADGLAPRDGMSVGEAQLRGPWVAASYYNLPELRNKWSDDGWFRTGDVVTVDANGYMKITDRAKDLIKSGDDWISSLALENALMEHPAVSEAAVIAVSHPQWQERPLAAVVLKPGENVSPSALREFLATRFAKWQTPDSIVFLSQLPHSPTGKLLKKELRQQFKNWKWEDSQVSAPSDT